MPWKERFFVLIGNILTCFVDHVQLDECKGEVFIFAETELRSTYHGGQQFGIYLANPFEPIQMAAISMQEQTLWMEALKKAINQAKLSLRAYMLKKGSLNDTSYKKKYFVLHQEALSYHKDKYSLSASQGCIYLNAGTVAEFNDNLQYIIVSDPSTSQT